MKDLRSEKFLERAGQACVGLTPDEILELISYMLWLAHFRRAYLNRAAGDPRD
jgi:hypothetical protein